MARRITVNWNSNGTFVFWNQNRLSKCSNKERITMSGEDTCYTISWTIRKGLKQSSALPAFNFEKFHHFMQKQGERIKCCIIFYALLYQFTIFESDFNYVTAADWLEIDPADKLQSGRKCCGQNGWTDPPTITTKSFICITQSLGAPSGARLLGSGPLGRLWALRACLITSFRRSGRVTHATVQ